MSTKKNYILDTNVLIENPESIAILQNGNENNIHIPYHVLIELNKLKNNPNLAHIVSQVVDILLKNKDMVNVIRDEQHVSPFAEIVDNYILREIKACPSIIDPILVTNDKILQLQAGLLGIRSEEFRDSRPFESESQLYTGFVDNDEQRISNCFFWRDGRPVFNGIDGEKTINYTLNVWNLRPRSIYQNLALELMQNQAIDLVTIQSEAGYGKTFLALASALNQVLEKKLFEKIYIVKPTIEVGAKLGFLPGDVSEKMAPYIQYIFHLLEKLHTIRPANKIFLDDHAEHVRLNPKKIEILPLGFIRGMTVENAFVIVDETQNLSRYEVRTLLSRMGEQVKCICIGDTRQVDNPHLNESNNGLNWIVKKCKGLPGYAHIVLKGEKSRGPITDMVIKSRL